MFKLDKDILNDSLISLKLFVGFIILQIFTWHARKQSFDEKTAEFTENKNYWFTTSEDIDDLEDWERAEKIMLNVNRG